MKLCVIGCGGIARSAYAPALKRLACEQRDLVLACCCDLVMASAQSYAHLAGFESCADDYARMVAAHRPDAILVLLPYARIAQVSIDLAPQGIPLLIEKPPGATLALARQLDAALKAHNTPHQIAFNRHHFPLIRHLKKALGPRTGNRHIAITMYRNNRLEPDFYSTAVHDIDLARYLADAPYQSATYAYQRVSDGADAHNAFLTCRFESGDTAQLSFLVHCGLTAERVQVHEGGRSHLVNLPVWNGSDAPGAYACYQDARLVSSLSGRHISDGEAMFESNGFYAQLKSFIHAVRTGCQPLETMDYAMSSMGIAEGYRRMLPSIDLRQEGE